MIATEVDESSIQTAVQHVENNNLQSIIKGKLITYYILITYII